MSPDLRLRWRVSPDQDNLWHADCGRVRIGFVVCNVIGAYAWKLVEINPPGRKTGSCKTRDGARRAVANAFTSWSAKLEWW